MGTPSPERRVPRCTSCAIVMLLMQSQLASAFSPSARPTAQQHALPWSHPSNAVVSVRETSRRSGSVALKIKRIEDTDSYHALIAEATAANRVVVIKFYASWCRACKAMAPKFERVSEDWPEIEFYEILFDNNKKLVRRPHQPPIPRAWRRPR